MYRQTKSPVGPAEADTLLTYPASIKNTTFATIHL
jgi:hypothetical protein